MTTVIDHFNGYYLFLNNFYPATVKFEDDFYVSVEHAFHAAKTLDKKERERVKWCRYARDAKKLGRSVKLRSDWESVKVRVMYNCVLDKFTRNDYLRNKLIETGNAELIEGNTWNDTFWGVCNGKGRNMLGKILMKVRAKLQAEVQCPELECELL